MVAFIANGFNIYFPIAIVLLCIATVFRLGSRLLHCIGFEQFIDDDVTQEIVDEGRNHVKKGIVGDVLLCSTELTQDTICLIVLT